MIRIVSAIDPKRDDGRFKDPHVCDFVFRMHEFVNDLYDRIRVYQNRDASDILAATLGHENNNSTQRWVDGKLDIPLVALETLIKMAARSNEIPEKYLSSNLQWVYLRSPNTREFTRIPLTLSDDLIYFVAVIIGDGCLTDTVRGMHIKTRDYRIYLEVADKQLVENVRILFHRLFNLNVQIKQTKDGYWQFTKRNKPLVRFLNRIFELPIGVKAPHASIPTIVRSLQINRQVPFLTGILDTDLGLHSKSIGSNFASERFRDDLAELLRKLGISVTTSPVYFKNGIYAQHEIRITKHSLPKLWHAIETYPLKNLNRRMAVERLIGRG